MAKQTQRLTAREVECKTAPGRYPDGDGLYLQVMNATSKSWLYRYQLNGKQRWLGLGSACAGAHTLAEARAARDTMREQVRRKIDPVQAKRQDAIDRKLAAAKSITFRDAAVQCVSTMRPEWSNLKHANQWDATLRTYAYPEIGNLPVADIDTAAVLKVLKPIWETKVETAKRVRGRIERVLNWATSAEYRKGENPARWRGHLDNLLARPSRVRKAQGGLKHHPALPYSEIGAFMANLREREGTGARALEFTILTAARTTEVLAATWREIDFEKALWTVPAERMGKGGKEHRVPLSPAALNVLKRVREVTSHHEVIFPNLTRGRQLSNMAMLKQIERINGDRAKAGIPEYADKTDGRRIVPHGFRSTFRDWAAEQTNFPNIVSEAALSHAIDDKVEAAYRRGELLEKRRRLMQAWANYCARPAVVSASENVAGMASREAAR